MLKSILSCTISAATLLLNAASPELDRYFAAPSIQEVPLDVQTLSEKTENGIRITALKFKGGFIGGKPAICYAWYTRPDRPGKFPGIVNIHGAGLRELQPNLTLPQEGFGCISIDWAGAHAKRVPPTSEFVKSIGLAERTDKTGAWYQNWHIGDLETNPIRTGVLFARRAVAFLQSRPEIEHDRIFSIGASAGAHLSLLLLGHEPAIKAAVVKYGNAFIGDQPKFYGGYFGPITLTPKEEQQSWLAKLDPKHTLNRIPQKVLLISGTNDIFFWMPCVLLTHRRMPAGTRLLMRPNDNHQWVGNDPISAKFFRAAMQPTLDWPDAQAPRIVNINGKLHISGEVSGSNIKSVKLIYKIAPLPFPYRESKQPWKSIEMQFANGKYTALLPSVPANEQLVAYLLAETDDGRLASGDTVEYPAYPIWRNTKEQ